MSDEFGFDILVKVVAQSCQMVGFERVTNSSIFMLTDIIRDFVLRIGYLCKRYAEHCGRSHVNLGDLSLAFYDLGISPLELLQFLELVNLPPQCIRVPRYPVILSNRYSLENSLRNIKVNDQVTGKPKEGLKIRISLSKIKEATKILKNKKKKKKRMRRKRGVSL
uniref:Bromodomain associated domain-containing protein n=1 Tax=Homalodisca liturata TaxID=320908 RepID=A0A1B6JNB7_9HEMI